MAMAMASGGARVLGLNGEPGKRVEEDQEMKTGAIPKGWDGPCAIRAAERSEPVGKHFQ